MLAAVSRLANAAAEHAANYAEVIAVDLATARRTMTRVTLAMLAAVVAALYTLALACLFIVAWFWDTPARMTAIGTLLAVFAAVLAGSLWYGWQAKRNAPPLLNDTLRELERDREVLG